MGLVPTTAMDPQPQRAEYYGGYSLVLLLKILFIRFHIKNLQAEIYIDNQNVVKTLSTIEKQPGLKQHLHDDFDLWESIRAVIEEYQLKIVWTWVKGHQDNLLPWEELSYPAQLNV